MYSLDTMVHLAAVFRFFLGEGVLIWLRYRAHLGAFGYGKYLIILFWWIERPSSVREVMGSIPVWDKDFFLSHARVMLINSSFSLSFYHKIPNRAFTSSMIMIMQKQGESAFLYLSAVF